MLRELIQLLDDETGWPAGSPLRRLDAADRRVARTSEPLRFADRDDAILPQYAIERLWQIVRDRGQLDDTIVTTGVGQHQMWAAQYWHFNTPRTWITSGGLGAMGFGLPAAMGAQAAHPLQDRHRHRRRRQLPDEHPGAGLRLRREAAGQGAAAQQPAPGHGGAVGRPLLREQPGPHLPGGRPRRGALSRLRRRIAKGFRCGARTCRSKEDLDDALEEMLDSKGPYVLDVLVPYQEHVLPMIPGGMTVRDIIKA